VLNAGLTRNVDFTNRAKLPRRFQGQQGQQGRQKRSYPISFLSSLMSLLSLQRWVHDLE